MMIAFTYLPAFVTTYFQAMPGVWKSRHRLMLCWLIFMQALYPGRKTLQEMSRWTPASITAWRFARVLKASYWNVHLLVTWKGVTSAPRANPGVLFNFSMCFSYEP